MKKVDFINTLRKLNVVRISYHSKVDGTIKNAITGIVKGLHESFFIFAISDEEEITITYNQVIEITKPQLFRIDLETKTIKPVSLDGEIDKDIYVNIPPKKTIPVEIKFIKR